MKKIINDYANYTVPFYGPADFVVKKANNMCCIETDFCRFLDIRNFIAPGYSYAKYFKAFNCTLKKGFFPYEWMDTLDKLKHTTLPPIECFYSSLRD